MTQMWDCTEAKHSLGVYVLGAIDPVERGMVDAHLETCQECRDELAGLAGLPALLARLDPNEVIRVSNSSIGMPVPLSRMTTDRFSISISISTSPDACCASRPIRRASSIASAEFWMYSR